MDNLRKVNRADRLTIPAAAYNSMAEAARVNNLARGGRFMSEQVMGRDRAGCVLVKNASGAPLPRFSIVSLHSPVFPPSVNEREFVNNPCMLAVIPDGSPFVWGVLKQSLGVGRIGLALTSGPTVVPLFAVLDVPYQFADADATLGTVALRATTRGPASIVWRAGGTGLQWAFVTLGHKADAVIAVSMEQVGGSQGTATTPASWSYTVRDELGTVLGDSAENPIDPVVFGAFRRPAAGYMTPASFGLSRVISGSVVIYWCNEVAEQEACPVEDEDD